MPEIVRAVEQSFEGDDGKVEFVGLQDSEGESISRRDVRFAAGAEFRGEWRGRGSRAKFVLLGDGEDA